MRLRADDRGVTVQVGTVLLFAVLVVLISTYQATVVPQQNERVEYNHNRQVHGELQDLRDELRRTAVTDSGGTTAVSLGTQFPERAFFVNPAPPSGTLATTSEESVSIENAVASGETRDYWNGSDRSFSTRGLTYRPRYSLYRDAPTTVYRNGVLYNRFSDANVTLAGQRLVEGDRISLVTLDGNLSESSNGAASVDARPVSAATRTVTVRNQEDENLSLVVPTTLPEEKAVGQWRELLADQNESRGDDRHVLAVEKGPNEGENDVRIVLEPGTYELEMAKVGVGSDVSGVESHYITDVRGDNASVPPGGRQRVVVEVRDRYNNPISGAVVNVSDPGKPVTPKRAETGPDGRATFVYEAPETGETERNVSFDINEGSSPRERATVTLFVDGGASGGGGVDGQVAYNDDAVANDGPDDGTVPGGVNFSVTNEWNQQITLTDLTVEPADESIDVLADQNAGEGKLLSEVYVDGDVGDGYVDFSDERFRGSADGTELPRTIDLDAAGRVRNGNPSVTPGGKALVYLYEFFDDTDRDANVHMAGEAVTVTMKYRLANGLLGEETFTITPGRDDTDGGDGGDEGDESRAVTYTGTYRTAEGTQDAESVLQVDLENELSEPVELTAVRVNDTTGPARSIREWRPAIGEVEIDVDGNSDPESTTDSLVGYEVGERIDLDEPAAMDGGSVARVQFYEFRKQNNDPTDMDDKRVTVTVYYRTASSDTETTTFTVDT